MPTGTTKTHRVLPRPIAVAATAAAATTTTAMILLVSQPASAVDIEAGTKLFEANCAGCHRGGNNFLAEKKTLRKEALETYQSLDPSKLQEFVQTKLPHNLLPFKKDFTDADYANAVGYVLDQALNDKW